MNNVAIEVENDPTYREVVDANTASIIGPQASISGGDFVLDSSEWPSSYRNKYLFADFVHGWIKTIDPASPAKSQNFAEGLRRPVDIRFGRDGELYVLLRNAWVVDGKFEGGTGALMRIDQHH